MMRSRCWRKYKTRWNILSRGDSSAPLHALRSDYDSEEVAAWSEDKTAKVYAAIIMIRTLDRVWARRCKVWQIPIKWTILW